MTAGDVRARAPEPRRLPLFRGDAAEAPDQPLEQAARELSWFSAWWRTAVPGALLLLVYFLAYELLERTILADASLDTLHALHIARGSGAAILLATWAFVRTRTLRRAVETALKGNVVELERQVERRTRDLEEARAFNELLFNSLRDRIVVLDSAGLVVKANKVALDHEARLLGRSCLDLNVACAEGGGCLAMRACQSGSSTGGLRTDTAGRIWDIVSIPMPAPESATRGASESVRSKGESSSPSNWVIEVGRDVTQERSLKAQLLHQEKMAGLGALTAGFAHDLGNPLASLSSELELLETEDDVTRFRASLDVLRRHVDRISRTLREMVDFARRRRDEVSDVSIPSVVADTARLVCHDSRWKRVTLDIEVPPDLPAVRMVEDHLVLVFLNLMLNAADAMPQGGRLTVTAHATPGRVVVRFRDTGVGMTEEVLRNALRPMFTTKHAGGTGLGLSVSADVVKAVGGTLTLTSAPNEGTEVTVTLPRAQADEPHG
ncbi:MAG: ATP-binding protein [Polyangiaceae bacterium]